MKRDTRQEILRCARDLFNERGFNDVSTRDIADALGISKGNLTYHFKKKEEIMEAILEEFPGPTPARAPRTLAELDGFFLHLQEVVEGRAFYFWHHAQLSQLSPAIRERQNRIFRQNTESLTQAFQTLQADGLLCPEAFPGEHGRVIDLLLLAGIYWLPFCDLGQVDRAQAHYRLHAWTTLHPRLTDRGRAELAGIVEL